MGVSSSVLTPRSCRARLKVPGCALVVSAYFSFRSKQPHSFYMPHVKRFLESVTGPLVFFTSSDLLEDLKALRPPELRAMTRFVVWDLSAWDAWKYPGAAFWDRQIARDAEAYHTPELAAVWFMKHKFVLRAAREMRLTEATPIVWCDAGALRDDVWRTPAASLSAHAGAHVGSTTNRIWVGELLAPKNPKDFKASQESSPALSQTLFRQYPFVQFAGAVLAGTLCAWKRFELVYAHTLQQYDNAGVAATSDQYIMSTMAAKEPNLFKLVSLGRTSTVVDACFDPWFALLCVLAAPIGTYKK